MDKLNCTSGQGKPLSERHLLDLCAAVIWAGSAGWAVRTRGLKSWLNPFVVGDGNSGYRRWKFRLLASDRSLGERSALGGPFQPRSDSLGLCWDLRQRCF